MPIPQLSEFEYVKARGLHCPVCSGDNLQGSGLDVQGGTAIQPVSCTDCNAEWEDVYRLVGYQNLEKDDD